MMHTRRRHDFDSGARGAFSDFANSPPQTRSVRARIMVVDDEPFIGKLIQNALLTDDVEIFQRPREALARAREQLFDVIVSDYAMPDMDGLELYAELARTNPVLVQHFVLMTGGPGSPALASFLREHRVGFLAKPFCIGDMERCVSVALGEL